MLFCGCVSFAVHKLAASSDHRQRSLTMTTILIINAISSLVAAASIGGLAARRNRRIRRAAQVQPLYVTAGTRRRRMR
jgi:hypothetical protein